MLLPNMGFFTLVLALMMIPVGAAESLAVSTDLLPAREPRSEAIPTSLSERGTEPSGPDSTSASTAAAEPGLFLQSSVQVGRDDTDENGFRLTKSWFKLTGSLAEGWSYLAQANAASEISLLDARIAYQPTEQIELASGVFKTPVSREWLTPAPRIPFTTRSRAVNRLSPKREVGVSARVEPVTGARLIGGLFNGNGLVASGNNDGRFLYTGRLEANLMPATSESSVQLGVSGAFRDRSSASSAESWTLAGADLKITRESFWMSSELLYRSDTRSEDGDQGAVGGHVTLARALPVSGPPQELLLRWDRFRAAGNTNSTDLLVAGYALNIDGRIGGRITYRLPLQEAAELAGGLVANLQLVW